MRLHFIGLIFLISMQLVHAQSRPDSFHWLTGVWKIKTSTGHIVEQWEKINDSLYIGSSKQIKGKDSILQEKLVISKQDGDWYYISQVSNQNNNQPVRFKIIFQRFGEFISENPAHDFPQKISYRRYLPMQLFASVEGNRKGKYAKQNFNFYKDEVGELFCYTLTPVQGFSKSYASDSTVRNSFNKHIRYIDSLGFKNIVLMGGNTHSVPELPETRVVIIRALNYETALSILAKDPARINGTHTVDLKPFTLQSWFPGNISR